ncbi:hypothetical protein N7478_004294 [Penicillium angulare]|uniref:uncharacterized protein n=1 Tax=Penicillium angulare TaxID=116970 RepID=UPI0025417F1E|nr:uncharacterized protein N7478_004294 [Penicillium angulare]KAJ5278922.1 hypothetical protein N7478_004294 [Penicillium angulare]
MTDADASLVQVAGAGFRLSLLLNAAACQLAQSKIEIHSIAKGISLFASTLKHVPQRLDALNLTTSSEFTKKTREIASQGQLVFTDINQMLDKLQVTDADEELRNLPVQERLKWCFRKQHVTYLLASLESLKLSLIVMLRILELAQLTGSNIESTGNGLAPIETGDAIAQEKAETQNMIIIRYWSVKRLDRMWDLVEQEALDAANNPTSQKINYYHSSSPNTPSAVRPLVATARGPGVTKLQALTFGDIDIGLSNIERSPKDMVQLSENAMNRLLSLWLPPLDTSISRSHERFVHYSDENSLPQVSISSDSDDESQDQELDGRAIRGYYLEGTTTDWRKPQSQQARYEAAQKRQQYSGYQAHVENDDSEAEEAPQRQESVEASLRPNLASDGGEPRSVPCQQPGSSHTNGGRVHSNSFSSGYPTYQSQGPDTRAQPYANTSFPPNQSIPRSQPPPPPSHSSYAPQASPGHPPQQYRYLANQEYYGSAPRTIPVNPNRASMPGHSPRGGSPSASEPPWPPRSQGYNNGSLQPRHRQSLYPLSTSSPESTLRPSPPRSAQRSPTHSRRSSREETRGRNKELTRTATRGFAGIGAIGAFMDALETFDIL